jgi:hypothetical protein
MKGKAIERDTLDYNSLIKTKKHNIGTKEVSNMAIIGDH